MKTIQKIKIFLIVCILFDLTVVESEELYPKDKSVVRKSLTIQLEEALKKVDGPSDSPFGIPIPVSTIKDKCLEHISDEAQKLKEGKYLGNGDWLDHVAKCGECCGPLMVEIWGDYVERVSQLPHIVIFFDHNNSEIKNISINRLEAFYDQHLKDGGKVFLVGRASNSGSDPYNRTLSGKRATSVYEFLIKLGTKHNQMEYSFFGWNPPQLDQVIATKYGILKNEYSEVKTPFKDEYSEKRKLNQSVVVVAY